MSRILAASDCRPRSSEDTDDQERATRRGALSDAVLDFALAAAPAGHRTGFGNGEIGKPLAGLERGSEPTRLPAAASPGLQPIGGIAVLWGYLRAFARTALWHGFSRLEAAEPL